VQGQIVWGPIVQGRIVPAPINPHKYNNKMRQREEAIIWMTIFSFCNFPGKKLLSRIFLEVLYICWLGAE
jgi:hypothetical protein